MRVAIPAALLFVVVIGIASERSFRRVLAERERSSRLLARHEASELEVALSRATKIPEMIAVHLETELPRTEAEVEKYLRDVVARNPEIYGSCISFEPHSFDPAKRWYAPYFYRNGDKPEFVQLGTPEYDYFNWEWYAAPKAADRARWSEPYFDEGGGNTIMTTYSVPFRRDGKFWGIATIDIAMSQLIERGERIAAGGQGYAMIVSKQGRFLAYPDKERIMRDTIGQLNAELGRRMTAGEDGFLRTTDPVGGRSAWVAFVPVQSGELSLALVYPESELMAQAFGLQAELIILGVIGFAVMLVTIILIARSVSRPMRELVHAAQQIAQGDFDHRIDTHAPFEEVRHLTLAFKKMTRDLRMRLRELHYTTTLKERLEGELSGARSIQMSLLPKTFPAFPDRPEIDIHAMVRPAREVGGDFYDYYFNDDGRLCLVIGDVSGKGMPAAVFMAAAKSSLKARAARAWNAAEIVSSANRELCEGNVSQMFVTLLVALLDVETGDFELCNAGHPPPQIVKRNGEVVPVEGGGGVALGVLRSCRYTVVKWRLAPGDTLFFFTDGVTEALNPEREFYSSTRLRTLLRSAGASSAQALTRRVVQDVRNFCEERDQADDIAVLAVRWLSAVGNSDETSPRLGQVEFGFERHSPVAVG